MTTRPPVRVLVDAGPLIAMMDRSEATHAEIAEWIRRYRGELITTWPVLTEVCHLLPSHLTPRLLQWVAAGGVTIMEVPAAALAQMAERMHVYADLPMDLADATLLWTAEQTGVMDILTLDRRDFGVYRTTRGLLLRDVLTAS
ncbi:MAG: hypothetical protein WCK74_04640 [Gemmatimonadaceae bacterium]|jgi:predicted nucleic acid-binding protein